MSTRAVYTFGDKHVYIHYDGYPKGAAAYFEAMQFYAKQNEPPATETEDLYHEFIYANVAVTENQKSIGELIDRRDSHADVEYGYTINNQQLTVHEIDMGEETQIWQGTIEEFLTTHKRGGI